MSGFTIIVIMLLVMLASVTVFLLMSSDAELTDTPEAQNDVEIEGPLVVSYEVDQREPDAEGDITEPIEIEPVEQLAEIQTELDQSEELELVEASQGDEELAKD